MRVVRAVVGGGLLLGDGKVGDGGGGPVLMPVGGGPVGGGPDAEYITNEQ